MTVKAGSGELNRAISQRRRSRITNKAHNDMDKNKRKESYEPPKMEILEIMVEQAILQWSGRGEDSDDSEFGDPSPTYLNW